MTSGQRILGRQKRPRARRGHEVGMLETGPGGTPGCRHYFIDLLIFCLQRGASHRQPRTCAVRVGSDLIEELFRASDEAADVFLRRLLIEPEHSVEKFQVGAIVRQAN